MVDFWQNLTAEFSPKSAKIQTIASNQQHTQHSGNRFSRTVNSVVDNIFEHATAVENSINQFEEHWPTVVNDIIEETLQDLEKLQTTENWESFC